MKHFRILCALCIILSGCATTELTYVYKSADYDPAVYKKMAVVAIVPNTHARVEIETAVTDALKAKGIHAVTTWSLFPMANNTELIKQAGFTGEKRKEIIREKVSVNNIDAILLVTMFDARREQRYVPGSSTSVGIGIGAPIYGYPYATYFGYAWEVTSEPGYYEDASKYYIESNLYDIASEKLLWTGQTRTEMSSTLETEAAKFGNVIVNRLIADSKAGKK